MAGWLAGEYVKDEETKRNKEGRTERLKRNKEELTSQRVQNSMNRSDVKRPLRVTLEDDPVLYPLGPQMLVDLVKLVKPGDQRRSHEDQPGGIGVISHLSQNGGGREEGGQESREVRAGMDGHVDPVGCHEGGQGVVDGDGVDGVTRAKDVAEADIVCEIEIAALKVSFSEVEQRRARIDCDIVILLTVKRHDTHRVKGVCLSSCGGFEVLVESDGCLLC